MQLDIITNPTHNTAQTHQESNVYVGYQVQNLQDRVGSNPNQSDSIDQWNNEYQVETTHIHVTQTTAPYSQWYLLWS